MTLSETSLSEVGKTVIIWGFNYPQPCLHNRGEAMKARSHENLASSDVSHFPLNIAIGELLFARQWNIWMGMLHEASAGLLNALKTEIFSPLDFGLIR